MAVEAERETNIKLFARRLKDMVGRTREPSVMLVHFKHDYLYDIYVLWKDYVDKNWDKIYDEFYKNKRSLM